MQSLLHKLPKELLIEIIEKQNLSQYLTHVTECDNYINELQKQKTKIKSEWEKRVIENLTTHFPKTTIGESVYYFEKCSGGFFYKGDKLCLDFEIIYINENRDVRIKIEYNDKKLHNMGINGIISNFSFSKGFKEHMESEEFIELIHSYI